MNDIAAKMRESVSEEMNQDEQAPDIEQTNEPEQQAPEPTEIELMAADSGWKPDKQDRDGNTLTAEEFMARKPLFNKIRNQGQELDDLKQATKTLKADMLKISKESQKENERLLEQLKAKKEKHLDNLEVDEVRNTDKQIESVKADMAESSQPEESQDSPAYPAFLKDNEWASDDNHPLSIAAEGIAMRYGKAHKGEKIDDEKMYKHIHDQVRKDFPEKFETKRTTNKVAYAKNRSTSTNSTKKGMTLNDVPDDGTRRIVENMARQAGKTVPEYLKNYTPDDFK